MKKYLLILLVIGVAAFSACDNDDDDGMSMQYEETQCANPWDASTTQENYIVEVRTYLENYGIKVLSIYIDVYDEDAGENCNACSCVTGRNIIISTPPADVDDAKELGFIIVE